MKRDRKHIVFFTPTLNRTGSEIVLFNLLPHALEEFEVTVITKYKGELYDQLPAGVNKHFLYRKQFGGLVSKISNKLRTMFAVNGILKKHHAATWYLNTIMLGDILTYAEQHGIRTIVHLHELQQMYTLLSEESKKRLAEYPEQIVANSMASAAVIEGFGRQGNIQVIYPSLDFGKVRAKVADLRPVLGIGPQTFVWVMSGTLDENKNPHFFVDIAKELKTLATDFKMIWIGGKPGDSSFDEKYKQYAIEQKCGDVTMWINKTGDNYYDIFSLADGFVLTSQLESFSLVTLEALFIQLPVVANPCVGVSEILGNNEYGYIAREKNSAAEMASKMAEYMAGKIAIDKQALKDRALEFSTYKIGGEWLEWMKLHI